MNLARLALLSVALSFPLTTAAVAKDGPYLFEQLKKPEYSKTLNALLAHEKNLEPWVKDYLKTQNGVDSPSQARTVQDKSYELYQVCQPHNCGGNFLHVLFVPGGSKAWALFTKDDGTSRFFGDPGAEIQAALKSAVK